MKWNGIEYPLITKTHSVTDYEVYWGNGALLMPMLEDTGEPFFFRKTLSGSSLGFNITSTQSSATWEIIVPDYYTELKTLDEKYIPDSVKGRADLEVNWNGSNSPSVYNIVSGTLEELKTKILAGEQIKVNIFSINHIPNNRFFFPVLRVLYNIENNNLEFTVMTDSGTIDKFIISI